jgi:hypothetical protein
MRHSSLLVFAVSVVVSSSAWGAAATFQPVQSPVSISRGEGYQQVSTATKVFIGDQIMAGPGGRGKILYPNGCVVDVNPGAVVTVTGKCYQPMTAGLEAPPERPFPWAPVVLGGVFVGAAICGAFCDDDDGGRRRNGDGDEPRSP